MASGPKMTLKAREFGREITNGNASSTTHSSNQLDKSSSQTSANELSTSQTSSGTAGVVSSSQAVTASITSIAKLTTAPPRKVGEVAQHPAKIVSNYIT
jgi:hypothetical protein